MYVVTVRNNDVHTNRLSQQIYFIFMEGFFKKGMKMAAARQSGDGSER